MQLQHQQQLMQQNQLNQMPLSNPGTPMGVATPGGGGGGGGYGFPMVGPQGTMSPAPGYPGMSGFETQSPGPNLTDAPSPAVANAAGVARKKSAGGGGNKRTPQDVASPMSPEGGKLKRARSNAGAHAAGGSPATSPAAAPKKKAPARTKKPSEGSPDS